MEDDLDDESTDDTVLGRRAFSTPADDGTGGVTAMKRIKLEDAAAACGLPDSLQECYQETQRITQKEEPDRQAAAAAARPTATEALPAILDPFLFGAAVHADRSTAAAAAAGSAMAAKAASGMPSRPGDTSDVSTVVDQDIHNELAAVFVSSQINQLRRVKSDSAGRPCERLPRLVRAASILAAAAAARQQQQQQRRRHLQQPRGHVQPLHPLLQAQPLRRLQEDEQGIIGQQQQEPPQQTPQPRLGYAAAPSTQQQETRASPPKKTAET